VLRAALQRRGLLGEEVCVVEKEERRRRRGKEKGKRKIYVSVYAVRKLSSLLEGKDMSLPGREKEGKEVEKRKRERKCVWLFLAKGEREEEEKEEVSSVLAWKGVSGGE
jgi:hypothetical protein